MWELFWNNAHDDHEKYWHPPQKTYLLYFPNKTKR